VAQTGSETVVEIIFYKGKASGYSEGNTRKRRVKAITKALG